MNNLTCKSGDEVLGLLKVASKRVGELQSKFEKYIDFLMIAQPIDAVISYIENNDIKIP